MKKVFYAIANFYWPFISLFFTVISLNNYKILILSNPKIFFFFLIKATAWLSFPDLLETWYRTHCRSLRYRRIVHLFSQHRSIWLPKKNNLFLGWTTSCLCAPYCTPLPYLVRTHSHKLGDSSPDAFPLPKRCKIAITIVKINATFSFLLKVWDRKVIVGAEFSMQNSYIVPSGSSSISTCTEADLL